MLVLIVHCCIGNKRLMSYVLTKFEERKKTRAVLKVSFFLQLRQQNAGKFKLIRELYHEIFHCWFIFQVSTLDTDY
jgi:hypothetical protein